MKSVFQPFGAVRSTVRKRIRNFPYNFLWHPSLSVSALSVSPILPGNISKQKNTSSVQKLDVVRKVKGSLSSHGWFKTIERDFLENRDDVVVGQNCSQVPFSSWRRFISKRALHLGTKSLKRRPISCCHVSC